MRSRFDSELKRLNNELIKMGVLIEKAIDNAITAFEVQDIELARAASSFDENINEKEKEIESLCLKLLLQQQPVAKDLRLISSALKMITDMERIGDQAADIADIVIVMSASPYTTQFEDISKMAKVTANMVTDSVDAFVKRDIALAQMVCDRDDYVDSLFLKVRGELIELISEDSQKGELALDMFMIAKYFERIGDHAVNVAEWVAFSITGKHKNGGVL